MPQYDYKCNKCNHQFSKILKIADRKVPEESPCPDCGETGNIDQLILTAPAVGDPIRIGVTKKDSGFNEVLKGIHSKTPGSKIDSYL